MNNNAINRDFDILEKEINDLKTVKEKFEKEAQRFPPLSTEGLNEILSLTIKEDTVNKLVTFLACLTAYTEDSQFNISFNAPSSSGKSFIPIEIASLFPKEDVRKIAYASPTAFFHDQGQFQKEGAVYRIDLERKILLFLDQPHNLLLQHLRPLLSHDDKEISIKITDKSQKHGLRTKNVIIRGYPTVVFCTAGLRVDEQEGTRLLLLSPETSQSKLKQSLAAVLSKEADRGKYAAEVAADQRRRLLTDRVSAIKLAGIKDIIIPDPDRIQSEYFEKCGMLKPRHQRDVKRVASIIKSLALLNLWHRELKDVGVIIASDEDIKIGLELWNKIAKSQEFGISPYIFRLLEEVICPVCDENGGQATRQQIIKGHLKIYGRPLEEWRLRREILPSLESAGLILEVDDPEDKRSKLIVPVRDVIVNSSPQDQQVADSEIQIFGGEMVEL